MPALKRINNELSNKFIPKFFCHSLPYHLVIGKYREYPCEFNLINENNMQIEVSISISNAYPFTAPTILLSTVMINNINKLYQIRNQSNKVPMININYLSWCSQLLHKLNKEDIYLAWIFTINKYPTMSKLWQTIPKKTHCLCCTSFTCGNNWNPGLSLYDLVSEYLLYKQFFFYTSPLMLKKIRNVFYKIFINDRWVLNNDTILYILKFCHLRDHSLDNIIIELLS